MNCFLWLEGVEGESGDPWHRGEIDILSAVRSYRIPKQHNAGGFANSGRTIGDLSVTKKYNEDSSKLVQAAASGKNFKNGLITFESKNKVVTLEMTNVSIAAFSSDKSVETISLIYDPPSN